MQALALQGQALPLQGQALAPQVVRNATTHWDEQTTRLFAAQAIDAFRAVAGEDLLHGVLDEEHLALLRAHLEGRIAGLEGDEADTELQRGIASLQASILFAKALPLSLSRFAPRARWPHSSFGFRFRCCCCRSSTGCAAPPRRRPRPARSRGLANTRGTR